MRIIMRSREDRVESRDGRERRWRGRRVVGRILVVSDCWLARGRASWLR
jgi:hypothetical protein